MHIKTIITLSLMVLIVALLMYVRAINDQLPVPPTNEDAAKIEEVVRESTPQSIAYEVDGVTYTLVDGKAVVQTSPDSASQNVLSIFGEPTTGDLDNDGDTDAAVLLSLTTGGSGTFYYAALALSTSYGYKSTNTLFLGDRIAPQTVEIHDGRAVYNYATRLPDEPMTANPSLGKSLWIHLDPKKSEIGEFVQNFEGEVDTTKMSLTTKPWTWLRTEYTTKPTFTSTHANSFVITFNTDNSFSVQTDCNGVGGNYSANGTTLSLTNMMSTLMYCEGSDESSFNEMLSGVTSYSFGTKGELLLKNDSGGSTVVLQ